jgi:protein-histidine pros-kinase
MRLRTKFNVVFLGCFAVGLAAGYVVLKDELQHQARDQSVQMAQLMLDAAGAVRRYTQAELTEVLSAGMDDRFRPQAIPAYAAMQTLQQLQSKHAGFSYREAVLNPTNPSHRPSSFEKTLIEHFRELPSGTDKVGEIVQGGVPLLYISRPIKVTETACLACHDTPARAPAAMVAMYGGSGGFGWKHQETIGSQVVTVPMSVPMEHAERTLTRVLMIYGAFGAATLLLLNVLLSRLILQPVERLSNAAAAISMGAIDHPLEPSTVKDEIGELQSSIARLTASVRHALRLMGASGGKGQ